MLRAHQTICSFVFFDTCQTVEKEMQKLKPKDKNKMERSKRPDANFSTIFLWHIIRSRLRKRVFRVYTADEKSP